MSDYKGAALMLPAMPKANSSWPTRVTTPIGSAPPTPSAASPKRAAAEQQGGSAAPASLRK